MSRQRIRWRWVTMVPSAGIFIPVTTKQFRRKDDG